METTTYTPEQIEADFKDLESHVDRYLLNSNSSPYVLETKDTREYYVVTIDFEEELDGINTALKFLSTLVKIDGSIIRTNINDDELVSNGKYIANLLIGIPSGTSLEFTRHTGLELTDCSIFGDWNESEQSNQSN